MAATISKIELKHKTVKVYYEKHTGEKKKPTLFFVHGLGGDLDAWQSIKKPLQKKGYSTIAIDLPGHGLSDHPKSAKFYKIQNLAESIKEVMQKEKLKKAVLVGHCFGAVISLAFAVSFPQNLTYLIVISPNFRPPHYINAKWKKILANHIINIVSFFSPPPIFPSHSIYAQGQYHKDYEWFGLAKTIIKNSLRSYLQSSKQIINLDLENQLNKIKTKTLIISGENDTIYPLSISKKIQSRIKDSKLEIIKGGNHVIVLNNAHKIYRLINSHLQTHQNKLHLNP